MKLKTKIISTLALATGLVTMVPQHTYAKAVQNKTVTIYLTRHGETTGNVMGRVQGWSNFPLTKNGIDVAKNLGYGLKGIKFAHAYAGDLTRQEVTAQLALAKSGNKNTQLSISPKLREGGYGSFEGDKIASDNAKISQLYGYKDTKDFQAKTGRDFWNKLQDAYYTLDKRNESKTKLVLADRAESSQEVQKRMSQEMNYIAKHSKNKDKILVVSSGMSINEYLSTIAGKKYTGMPLKNACVTKLIYKNGKFKVAGDIGSMQYVDQGAKFAKHKKSS